VAGFGKTRWPKDGPVRELLSYLDALHVTAGRPSMSEIGRAVALARSTVAAFFNGTRLIGRGNLELVVEHLGGDVVHAERFDERPPWRGAHQPALKAVQPTTQASQRITPGC